MPQARRLYLGVGILMLTGIALATGFVLFLTSGRLGRDALIHETYLRESVIGLDVGSAVRFRGVSVGRVTEITFVAAAYPTRDANVGTPEFRLVLIRFAIDGRHSAYATNLDDAVRNGLRARLSSQGITGVSYLELDFVEPDRFPVPGFPWQPRFPVVPSVPSTVAQVTSAAERLVQRLDTIDFEGLLGNLTGLLADLRRVIGSDDVARALHEAADTLTALRGAVADSDIAGTLRAIREAAASVNEAAESADRLVGSPDLRGATASIGQVAADLRAAIARLPTAIQSLDGTIRAARVATTDTQADLVPLLRDLRAVAANLRDVTEALRRSPSQTLLGAPPPPERR